MHVGHVSDLTKNVISLGIGRAVDSCRVGGCKFSRGDCPEIVQC